MPQRTLIAACPPAPVDDLRVDQIAGACLSADIYKRHLAQAGMRAYLVVGVDAHQSQVEASAFRQHTDPESLSARAREAIKVLDFGISKLPNLPGDLRSALTRTGLVMGTPHYMPLEQMRGKPIDQRADIYALGVVLYQMLSGRLPYQLHNFGDLLLAMASEPPQPLERAVRGLPPGILAIVDKALSRVPDDRHADLNALLAALEPFATGSPALQLSAAAEARRLLGAPQDRAPRLLRVLAMGFGVLLVTAAAISFGLLPHHGAAHREQPSSEAPAHPAEPQPSAAAEPRASIEPEVPASFALEPEPPAPKPRQPTPSRTWRSQPPAARHHPDLNEAPPIPSQIAPQPLHADPPAWRVPVMTPDEF